MYYQQPVQKWCASCGRGATFSNGDERSCRFLRCSQCGRRQRAIEMYWHQREVRYDEIKDEITMENLAQSTRRAPRLRNQAQHHAPKLSTVQKISTLVGEEGI